MMKIKVNILKNLFCTMINLHNKEPRMKKVVEQKLFVIK